MDPFRSYDVRGLYPQEVNEELFEKIGRAFVLLYKLKKVYVGYDCRRSSESLHKAFIAGALAQGADVVDLGLSSTPLAYFATKHGAAAIITASHLGRDFNGVKMVLKDLAHVDDIPGIKALTIANQWPDATPGTVSEESFLREYVDALNKEGTPSDKKIVVDCGNGMASLTATPFLQRVADPTFLFYQMDGLFPHRDPNPLIDPLTKLREQVLKDKALFGVAYDSDCDRLYLVDELGDKILGDHTALLLALSIAKKGDTVVLTPNLSKLVAATLESKGIKIHYSMVGHVYIKTEMKKTGAVFGAELSGHFYFKSMNGEDSADLAIVHLLNLIEKPVSQLIKPYPIPAKSEEINYEVNREQALEAVTKEFGTKEEEFGIWHKDKNFWFLIRKSTTEELVRLVAEADTKEELDAVVKKISDMMSACGGRRLALGEVARPLAA